MQGAIQEIMKLYSSDPKLRFSADSISAIEEVIRSFAIEIVWRTANQASNEGLNSVNIEHLEKIIPQLVKKFKLIFSLSPKYMTDLCILFKHFNSCWIMPSSNRQLHHQDYHLHQDMIHHYQNID